MSNQLQRLQTFSEDTWRKRILAENGLFYTCYNVVCCYYCGSHMPYWDLVDCVQEVHSQTNPTCCLPKLKKFKTGTGYCHTCMENDKSIVLLLPCGHSPACTNCVSVMDLCPLCRCTIRAFAPIYK